MPYQFTIVSIELQVFRQIKVSASTFPAHEKHFRSINKNKETRSVSEEVKNIVRRNFTNEIEFYEFCKARLFKQFNALPFEN